MKNILKTNVFDHSLVKHASLRIYNYYNTKPKVKRRVQNLNRISEKCGQLQKLLILLLIIGFWKKKRTGHVKQLWKFPSHCNTLCLEAQRYTGTSYDSKEINFQRWHNLHLTGMCPITKKLIQFQEDESKKHKTTKKEIPNSKLKKYRWQQSMKQLETWYLAGML